MYAHLSPKEIVDMFDVIAEDNIHTTDYLSDAAGHAAICYRDGYRDNAVWIC